MKRALLIGDGSGLYRLDQGGDGLVFFNAAFDSVRSDPQLAQDVMESVLGGVDVEAARRLARLGEKMCFDVDVVAA